MVKVMVKLKACALLVEPLFIFIVITRRKSILDLVISTPPCSPTDSTVLFQPLHPSLGNHTFAQCAGPTYLGTSMPFERCKLILNNILKGPKSPNIIFLQEVTSDV